MQLALGEDSEGKWAVEKIIVHLGSGKESVFQVQWKAGDVTWLPLYQIAHLNVLPVYLDLLGVEDVTNYQRDKACCL